MIWMVFIIVIYKKMNFRIIKSFMLILIFASYNSYAENHVITINITENEDSITITPQLSFKTSDEIKEAIDNGIRIQIIAKGQISEPQSWWFDQTINNKKINLEISYFTLGKLYIVKNKDTGEQLGFNDYEQLWEEFEKLMTFKYTKFNRENKWFKMRIMLDKGALPTAMQLPVLFNSHWDINTPWYQQSVDMK